EQRGGDRLRTRKREKKKAVGETEGGQSHEQHQGDRRPERLRTEQPKIQRKKLWQTKVGVAPLPSARLVAHAVGEIASERDVERGVRSDAPLPAESEHVKDDQTGEKEVATAIEEGQKNAGGGAGFSESRRAW